MEGKGRFFGSRMFTYFGVNLLAGSQDEFDICLANVIV